MTATRDRWVAVKSTSVLFAANDSAHRPTAQFSVVLVAAATGDFLDRVQQMFYRNTQMTTVVRQIPSLLAAHPRSAGGSPEQRDLVSGDVSTPE